MDVRFAGLSTEELADVWYATAGADTRHPGRFSNLVDAMMYELNQRLDDKLAPFIKARFESLRPTDVKEDVEAAAKATVDKARAL